VVELLNEKREILERVTKALLELETLNGEQFVRVVDDLPLEEPPAEPPKDKEEKEPPRVVPKIKPNLGGA
jgi:cell division protease FtsH